LRDQIAMGNWGIIERKAAPTVGEFLRQDFIPWARIYFQNKNTLHQYLYGARQLLDSNIASIPMDSITSEHTSKYIDSHRHLSNAGINPGFRCLRRALSLALEWRKIDRKPKIPKLEEARRDRILSYDEEKIYLANCIEPWATMATIMLDCGCRPQEVMILRWEKNFDWPKRMLKILHGKSKAARRELLMSERVMEALEDQGVKESGFVFPALVSKSRSGHISQQSLNRFHQKALKTSKIPEFDPYSLRHTCLTRMAEYTSLPTLKVIAGHSQIEMTMRYVHPERDAIEKAFRESESRYKNRHRAKMHIVRKNDKEK